MINELKYNSDLGQYLYEFKIDSETHNIHFSEFYYENLTENKLKEIIKFVKSSKFKKIIIKPIEPLRQLAKYYFDEYKIKNEDLESEFDFTFSSIIYDEKYTYELCYFLYLPKRKEGDCYGTWKARLDDFMGNFGSNTITRIEREQQ